MDEHHNYWMWLGGVCAAGAVAAAGIEGNFLASRDNYPFWTAPPMIVAYVFSVGAILCLVLAVRHVPFPGVGRGTPSEQFSARIRSDGRRALKRRRRRVHRLKKEIPHRKGCPEDLERIEMYPQTRQDGSTVETIRCLDCGEAIYRNVDEPAATRFSDWSARFRSWRRRRRDRKLRQLPEGLVADIRAFAGMNELAVSRSAEPTTPSEPEPTAEEIVERLFLESGDLCTQADAILSAMAMHGQGGKTRGGIERSAK